MKLAKYIANLGYGSRREVMRLLDERRVRRRDGSPLKDSDDFAHDDVLIDGKPLDPARGSLVMLNKPAGFVCSTSEATRLVYELLPPRFLRRSPVMAPVGRLDRDTTGLLLLSDDGQLNHRLTSPRTHVAKTYEVQLADDLRGDEADLFGSGTLMLKNETEPLRPATLEVLGPRRARITLTEGRYHQVRRMFAAVGNHVEALHRSTVGPLALGDLAPGAWRVLGPEEVRLLRDSLGTS